VRTARKISLKEKHMSAESNFSVFTYHILEISPAPAGDRGLDVLKVPLQGPLALGAAPAAVVLAGGEHPA